MEATQRTQTRKLKTAIILGIIALVLASMLSGCVRVELQEYRIERELEWPAPVPPPTRA